MLHNDKSNHSDHECDKARTKALSERSRDCLTSFLNSDWEEERANKHKAPDSEGNTG